MITITLPDNSKLSFKEGITALKVAEKIGIDLAKASLAAKVNHEIVDLNSPIKEDSSLKLLTFKDEEGKSVFRHSTSHILAAAVKKLFPDVKLGIGPAVEDGFYYDFDKKEPFTPDDLKKIEHEMNSIIKSGLEFERKEISKAEGKKLFKNEPYKLEILEETENPTIYKLGSFTDLCKGPHVPSTKKIGAVKLTKIAGAYWKADSKNPQLQRIYGISFPDEKELSKYLKLLEEAEKRDHRKLGKQMNLFSIHEEAPGMPFFHNKGAFVFDKLAEFMKGEMRKLSYELNKTPIILNKNLWLQSGHWDHYKDSMYFTKIENQDFAVKPMNCPGNILIFKERVHSYRELPIKAGEFGLVHRNELSGVLSGLFRVRAFTQDDAHIFCTEEQLKEQMAELLSMVDKIYSTFEFKYDVELSTKPLNAMGDPKKWELAESILADALKERKIKYKLNLGEGAFYGPKIDFHINDALGRKWQCGTIQLDFAMPEKFDLTYEGKDGRKHRPVMLHRTIYGSFERFIGILIEHFAGFFPLWLAPVQARVITVSDKFNQYAEKIVKELNDAGLRIEFDERAESVGYKIRDAQLSRIPILINIGEKEENAKTIAVRTSDNKVKFGVKTDEFIKRVLKNIEDKEIEFRL